jgi:putative ABC transport system permease protein
MNGYALRTLLQARGRLVLSVGGVALALALMLALDAIVGGTESRITAYIDHSEADIWVSQAGVRTMHMSASTLPAAVVEQVRAVPGVSSVTPILYVSTMIVVGQERVGAYVIGLPTDAASGVLWDVEGTAIPSPGGAIVDRGVAAEAGAGLGDRVTILGQPFTITGLSGGTTNLVSSVVVVPFADFARLRGGDQTVSYLLVRAKPHVLVSHLATVIGQQVPGVTVQTRQGFAAQERRLVRDMSTDLVSIMNLIGVVIGLAVMALTTYTAVLARRREYGVLKALGARNGHLYRAVLLQALLSIGLGLLVGLIFTAVVAILAPRVGTNLTLVVTVRSVLRVAATGLVVTGLAALLPIRQLATLDPAMVFRRVS